MYKGLKEGAKQTEEIVINDDIRQGWNQYVDWLDKKGLKGHQSLDKDDTGGKMIDKYREENPNTVISRDLITPIQKEFSRYRDYRLKEVEEGKYGFAEGTNKDNFMNFLSKIDGIAGQRTTSFKFPDDYLKTKLGEEVIKTEKTGFSKTADKK